ncbi:zinc knuckle-domain-containing protein [Armillaria luteobubalina]|uniref:Zinc knuckle-domain-containing protein n=1 Tax=Armillaria luteobubalina TaxID=153913 RepID=A0AA39UZ29_9AGAR|nr:zinc knuckle-domain-containing protein [Armillaria luteobubalina]
MSKYAPHHRSTNNPTATSSTVCQKCLGSGHFTYQCKNTRPYVSRPSRTQQLENPRVLAKLKADGKPSVEVPEEFKNPKGTANKILAAKEKEREEKEKAVDGRKKRARSSSSSDSSSDSDSDSDSDSSSGSDSDSGLSASGSSGRGRGRKRRRSRSRSSSSSSRARAD